VVQRRSPIRSRRAARDVAAQHRRVIAVRPEKWTISVIVGVDECARGRIQALLNVCAAWIAARSEAAPTNHRRGAAKTEKDR